MIKNSYYRIKLLIIFILIAGLSLMVAIDAAEYTKSPSINKVTSSSTDGTYSTGQTISIQVIFSNIINVTGSPQLALNTGGNAIYSSGSGSSTLTFNYTINTVESISALNYVSSSSLSLNGGTIRDIAGRDSTLILPNITSDLSLAGSTYFSINLTQPIVTNVTTSCVDGHYGPYAKIPIQIIFSKAVIVTGIPQLSLNTGRTISYMSGSGTNTLVFNYDVLSTDTLNTLNYLNTTSLTLNGGTIKDSSSNDAILTLPRLKSKYSLYSNNKIYIDTKLTRTLRDIGGSNKDRSSSVLRTDDGGYIVAGSTQSIDGDFVGLNKGNVDIYLIKYNSSDVIEWKKNYGGTGDDYLDSVIKTDDGGYIVSGLTQSTDGDFAGLNKGNYDACIIKVTNNGTISWTKTYGGSSNDELYATLHTSDGGYLLSLTTYSIDGDSNENKGGQDILLLKIDSIGNVQWRKLYAGSQDDYIYKILSDNDNGYILIGETLSNDYTFAGYNHSANYEDGIIMKIDSAGNIIWMKNFGGTGTDYFNSGILTSDGNIIVVGDSDSTNGDCTGYNKGTADGVVIKYDLNGNILWHKNYGGTNVDLCVNLQECFDKNFMLIMNSSSTNGNFSARIAKGSADSFNVKISPDGTILWYDYIGGSSTDYYCGVTQLSNSSYILAGYTSSTNGDFTGLNKGSNDIDIIKIVETQIDVTPPTIPIINLTSSGWTSSNNSFTLTNGTDDGVGIKKSQYRIDEGSWTDYNSQVTIASSGWHVIEAQTIDNNNNVSSISTATFGIDTTSDVPTIDALPSSQEIWTNSPINIALSYGDSLSGTANRCYKWDIDSVIEDNNWINYNDTPIQAPLGTNYLQVNCVDNAGNITTKSYGPYKFDNKSPNVTVSLAQSDWTKDSINISIISNDNESGMASFEYKFDTDNIIEDDSWIICTGSVTDNIDGLRYIDVKSIDNIGNVTMQSYGPYKYDATIPSKPIIDYDAHNNVVIINNIQDNTSSVKNYYSINSGTQTEYISPISIDHSCTIESFNEDAAGNKSDSTTYYLTIPIDTLSISFDSNIISFNAISPINSEYELKNALKANISCGYPYNIKLNAIDNFKSVLCNNISSNNLGIKLSSDLTYSFMESNTDIPLASSATSSSGRDFYIDAKLLTQWTYVPDNYNAQINFIVTITP